MYYICKFSESWSIYDGKRNNSRPLEKSEVDFLKNLFPALLNDPGKILTAMQITSIQPNKLLKLTEPVVKNTSTKTAEISKT